jgi:hypothetical protein
MAPAPAVPPSGGRDAAASPPVVDGPSETGSIPAKRNADSPPEPYHAPNWKGADTTSKPDGNP